MVLDNYDLEQIADDLYKDRRIIGSVYCGNCGYNLRTLPYVYTCPECGSKYNARPLVMQGIFAPYEIEFPFRDIMVTLICGLGTLAFAAKTINAFSVQWLVLTVLFIVLTASLILHAHSRLARYFKAVEISRRVAEQEREADA